MKINNIDVCFSIVGLASSAVLFTDSHYVYDVYSDFHFGVCQLCWQFVWRWHYLCSSGSMIVL